MEILIEHALNAHFNQQVSVLGSEETEYRLHHIPSHDRAKSRQSWWNNEGKISPIFVSLLLGVATAVKVLLPDCQGYIWQLLILMSYADCIEHTAHAVGT